WRSIVATLYSTKLYCAEVDGVSRRLPANRGPVRTCSGFAPVWADWPTLFISRNRVLEARAKICVHLEIALAAPYAADFVLHFATMARFRSPEIDHRHSPAFVQISSGEG